VGLEDEGLVVAADLDGRPVLAMLDGAGGWPSIYPEVTITQARSQFRWESVDDTDARMAGRRVSAGLREALRL